MAPQAKTAVTLMSLAVLAGWLAVPATARQSDELSQIIARRLFVAQADNRCHQLDPATAMAVKGGYVQARNEALRHGHDMASLAPLLEAARAAAARVDCNAPQLSAEVSAAGGALRAFTAQTRLTLDGWSGDRSYPSAMTWRLVQYQPDAAAGLYGPLGDTRLVVMTRFADGERPYSARLMVRDPNRLATGIITSEPRGLSDHLPAGLSPQASTVFMATNISNATVRLAPTVKANMAGISLSGEHVGDQSPVAAMRFDFPTKAYVALAKLDPREDMVVAFDFSDGTRYLRFEVGDFITGLSYVNLPNPYGPLKAL